LELVGLFCFSIRQPLTQYPYNIIKTNTKINSYIVLLRPSQEIAKSEELMRKAGKNFKQVAYLNSACAFIQVGEEENTPEAGRKAEEEVQAFLLIRPYLLRPERRAGD
jgi:hypothetical protein